MLPTIKSYRDCPGRQASGAGLGPESTLAQLQGAWGDDPRWARLSIAGKARLIDARLLSFHERDASQRATREAEYR